MLTDAKIKAISSLSLKLGQLYGQDRTTSSLILNEVGKLGMKPRITLKDIGHIEERLKTASSTGRRSNEKSRPELSARSPEIHTTRNLLHKPFQGNGLINEPGCSRASSRTKDVEATNFNSLSPIRPRSSHANTRTQAWRLIFRGDALSTDQEIQRLQEEKALNKQIYAADLKQQMALKSFSFKQSKAKEHKLESEILHTNREIQERELTQEIVKKHLTAASWKLAMSESLLAKQAQQQALMKLKEDERVQAKVEALKCKSDFEVERELLRQKSKELRYNLRQEVLNSKVKRFMEKTQEHKLGLDYLEKEEELQQTAEKRRQEENDYRANFAVRRLRSASSSRSCKKSSKTTKVQPLSGSGLSKQLKAKVADSLASLLSQALTNPTSELLAKLSQRSKTSSKFYAD